MSQDPRRHFIVVVCHRHISVAAGALQQGLALGGGDDPGLQARGVDDPGQVRHEAAEHRLENVGSGVVVVADAADDGVDQPLVALDQRLPGLGVALAAAGYQHGVAVLYPQCRPAAGRGVLAVVVLASARWERGGRWHGRPGRQDGFADHGCQHRTRRARPSCQSQLRRARV
jgi:hypothetical protein